MQKNNPQQDPLVVSDVFELAGDFDVATRAAFAILDERVDKNEEEKELVRYELELVRDLCTNSEPLTNEQLQRVAVYLNDKLNSVAK
jgi:hypothetical protein